LAPKQIQIAIKTLALKDLGISLALHPRRVVEISHFALIQKIAECLQQKLEDPIPKTLPYLEAVSS